MTQTMTTTKTTRCCPEMQQTATTLGVLKTPANKKKKKKNNNINKINSLSFTSSTKTKRDSPRYSSSCSRQLVSGPLTSKPATLYPYSSTSASRATGVPTAAFQSINPGMILALTPVINRYWKYQSETNREPDQVMKMAIGCCLLGLANVLLAFASTNLPTGAVAEADLPPGMKLNQFWIWLYFLVATAGELYVSPVGLSFVTTAAPKEIVGFACGCWFLSSFFGNYLAGEIGSLYASAKPFAFWSAVGVLSVSVGVALALARNKIVLR